MPIEDACEYTYMCPTFRVKRLDKFSLICEVFRPVTNAKANETVEKWVHTGSYYGSWQGVYAAFGAYLEENMPVPKDLPALTQAMKAVRVSLDALFVQGQILSALETPGDMSPEERIALALKAARLNTPFSHDCLKTALQAAEKAQATSPSSAPPKKAVKRQAKGDKVVGTPPTPVVSEDPEEDDEWG